MTKFIRDIFKICYVAGMMGLFCSCQANFYAPNTLNMPLARYKKEAKIKAYTSLNESGYQASYSVTNHVLLHTDGSLYYNSSSYGSSTRTLFEGGIGLFQRIERTGCFEILGGYGYGSGAGGYTSTHYYLIGSPTNEITDLSGYYQRIYIQPDIGFSHRKFELGAGLRYSIFNVENLNYSDNYYDQKTMHKNYGFAGSYTDQKIYLLEPCVHAGFEDAGALKFCMSFGLSTFQAGSPNNSLLNQLFLKYFITLGVTLNINRDWGD